MRRTALEPRVDRIESSSMRRLVVTRDGPHLRQRDLVLDRVVQILGSAYCSTDSSA